MKKTLAIVALAAATALTLTGCGGGDPLAAEPQSSSGADSGTITIGSADFIESQLIATIYSQALQDAGVEVNEKFNIGSREVYMAALKDGSIDLVPEYSGALLKYLDQKSEASTTDDVVAELSDKLPEGLKLLDVSEAQDKDVIAVTQETADKYNLEKISDLAPVGDKIVLGGPAEWKTRVNGLLGLQDLYGIHFKNFVTLDAGGPLTMTALTSGQIQAGDVFSTDPGLKKNNLVALEDDKSLFAAENVVPVITESKATDTITETLNAVSAKLSTDDLIEMNAAAADGEGLDKIAAEWLKQAGI
jgi:osmoprotectant transport system substrate-binding protein